MTGTATGTFPSSGASRSYTSRPMENLAKIHLDQRDLATAIQFGQLAISADQCCEPAHRLLMRCYALQHQQQLVSRQYQLCSAALHNELGVSPGADTVRLFHSLTSRV
jgi:DNA-binding SARP family transcriptional activator